MGENNNNIFVIGSPDVDIILKKNLIFNDCVLLEAMILGWSQND